jgi:4-hydroxy-2-oxoheptanedioate aldolase
MPPNSLKEKLLAGTACINAWLMIPSVFAAESVARVGWYSATIDIQHGVLDYLSAAHLIQAVQAVGVTPLARVPWNEPGMIGKVLDAGAWGVICPMVNTASDAQALARACMYPPLGSRSFGPVRARHYGGDKPYHEISNDTILVLPQIETREAVDNIGAILDVPGISGIYVGPGDLGLSLGLKPTLDREEPEVLEIYRRLLTATAARGLIAGIQNATAAYAVRMVELGFTFLTVASDLGFLASGARDCVQSFRNSVGVIPGRL